MAILNTWRSNINILTGLVKHRGKRNARICELRGIQRQEHGEARSYTALNWSSVTFRNLLGSFTENFSSKVALIVRFSVGKRHFRTREQVPYI